MATLLERLVRWLPVGAWVALAAWRPAAIGLSSMPGNGLDRLTGFCLLILALSFARLHLPWQGTVAVGSALLIVAGWLITAANEHPQLTIMAGVVLGLLEYRYRSKPVMREIGRGLAILMPYGLWSWMARGPLPAGVGLVVTLIGGAVTVAATVRAQRSDDPRQAQAVALWGGLVGAVGLESPLGVIAAAWALLVLAALDNTALPVLRIPLPLTGAFTAWWLLVAAAAGSASWLFAGQLILAALGCGVVATRRSAPTAPATLPERLLLGLFLLAGLLCGPLTLFLLPMTDPLAIGLSQLGIVDARPWIGLAALNAAHQRVMILPAVLLGALALVILSIVLLLNPQRRSSHADAPAAARSDTWSAVQERVWWLRRG